MQLEKQITLLTRQEHELLLEDRLPESLINPTGMYLTCEEDGTYTASDYLFRQAHRDFEKEPKKPRGYTEIFQNPLAAIDWLLLIDKRESTTKKK